MTAAFDRRGSTYPDSANRNESNYPNDISNLSRINSMFPNAVNRKNSILPCASNRRGSIFPDALSRKESNLPDDVSRWGSTLPDSMISRRGSIFRENNSRRDSNFPENKSRRGSIFPEAKNRKSSKFPDQRRSNRPPDAKFKVLLLGDMGVGKTSLFFRIKDDDFSHLRNLTLGLDMCVTRISVGDAEVEISLCDTAGSERYRTLTRNFYRNAQAILFVCSVDNPASLYGLGKWDEDARMYAPTAVRFLVGNKSDLPLAVNDYTLSNFASSHECEEAFVVSAKTGEGVAGILSQVSEQLLWRYKEAQKDQEGSWMDDTVNIYKGEDIPGLKSQAGSGCCK